LSKYEYAVELDLKRFDQHVGPEVIKVAFSILRSCYPKGEKYDNLFNYYCSSFINKNIIIPGGYIYRVKKSIATGSPFTSIIGNLSNWIIQTCVLKKMGISNYDLMVYGDDTLILLPKRHSFCISTYQEILFDLFEQTADPINIKKTNNRSMDEEQPTFLKTFSFLGFPSRRFSDIGEKLFFPEKDHGNLIMWNDRTKQMLYSSPFNYNGKRLIYSFLRFINFEIYNGGKGKKQISKDIKTGKKKRRYLSTSEFVYDSPRYFQRIFCIAARKFLPPNSLRQGWTSYSFEVYKDKFFENHIVIPKRQIMDSAISSLYGYDAHLTYLYIKCALS
jgi:hypothetical protein